MKQKNTFSKDELKMPEEHFGVIEHKEPAHLGIILGILIILLMFILGGLYMWGEYLQEQPTAPTVPETSRPTAEENNEPESTNAEAEVETLNALSTSDELTAIEADIESTNLGTLDVPMNSIETLINQ